MDIKVDSRKVVPGDTFIALRGVSSDGHSYIEQAIKNGAVKIIAEEGNYSVETVIVSDTRKYLVNYLKSKYSKELESVKLIGITGTNGKTTTGFLTYQLLNLLGHKSAYIGTIGFYTDKKERDLANTTPDIWDLVDLLLESYNKGCKYLVMEVSSQAIDMGRIEGLEFSYAVFTNLTQDHLDYHKTIEHYKSSKVQLFSKLKKDGKAIINVDDENHKDFLFTNNINITYGLSESDYQIVDYNINKLPSLLEIMVNGIKYKISSKLLGKYNLYNLLVAFIIGCDVTENIDKVISKTLELTSPDGRMDTILIDDKTIIIDYAHTPDAVLNILETINEIKERNIYTVIGCGGNRDKSKRSIMASFATKYSDMVIFTSDNPRFEKPEDIISDMVSDLVVDNYIIEIDRAEAIKRGLDMLQENDILLILGKGHEKYQEIEGVKHHFDDKEQVNIYLQNIKELTR